MGKSEDENACSGKKLFLFLPHLILFESAVAKLRFVYMKKIYKTSVPD